MDRLLQQIRPLDILGYLVPGLCLVLLMFPMLPESVFTAYDRIPLEASLSWVLCLLASYPIGFVMTYTSTDVISKLALKAFEFRKPTRGKWLPVQEATRDLGLFKGVRSDLEKKLGESGMMNHVTWTPGELYSMAESVLVGSKRVSEIDRRYAVDRMVAGLAGVSAVAAAAYLISAVSGYRESFFVDLGLILLIGGSLAAWSCRSDYRDTQNTLMSLALAELAFPSRAMPEKE